MTELNPALAAAADAFIEVCRAVESNQLGAKTPCAEYDVRGLVNHLRYWAPQLEAAARKQPASARKSGEQDVDRTRGDWANELARRVEATLDAFAAPGAFEGLTQMGGSELPAAMVARMVLAEWVLHGWDLAMAVGRQLRCDSAAAEAIVEVLATIAPQGRDFGAFGPEVAVPASAPPLVRAVALSGRDPGWQP